MTQRLLFAPSIQEAFEKFDAEHPDVWSLFVRFALELKAAGRERYGAKAVWERIRWHYATTSDEEPLLNNNFTSRYARKLMQERPEFRGFFEIRRLKA